MTAKRIVVLMHADLIPPPDIKEGAFDPDVEEWTTEFDVVKGLKKAGFEVDVLGVRDDLDVIRQHIASFQPDCVFNLLEEFNGIPEYDQNVVSYLELLGIPYTGSNPRGLILGRDKAIAKKIFNFHGIKTPHFDVFPVGKSIKRPAHLSYPMIVKCLNEEASLGLSQASVVHSDKKLIERVVYLHEKLNADAIVEEFIAGKEYFVGIMGNKRLKALPVMELHYANIDRPEREIYSQRAKWNKAYRKRKGIVARPALIDDLLAKKIKQIAHKTFKALELSGYARIDMRVDQRGQVFVIEANPNPNIARIDEFADSARAAGMHYDELLSKIISLGIQWNRLVA